MWSDKESTQTQGNVVFPWNEEVAEAVRNKKIKYGKWKRENMKEARMEYKKSRQNAKKVISSAKEKKQKNVQMT